MLQNIPGDSPLIDASFEIILMLSGAFVLGYILAWLIKPRKHFVVLDAVPLDEYKNHSLYPVVTKKSQSQKIDISQEKTSGNESDIPQSKPVGDNLSLIYGLTPKVEKLLFDSGIDSYQTIVDADVEGLEKILLDAGTSYKRYNPATWPDQARLASKGHWRELEEYQAILQKKK
ncbi:hypothetical protein LAT59_03435 [Candidatus Gracilibacteria bacterium]|nr:hypothetical protein [Candidatus Gracilibacteria bacterium]